MSPTDAEARILKEKGFELDCFGGGYPGLVQVNGIRMFEHDAADLAHDRATLPLILERNKGKMFPDAPRQ